MVAGSEVVAILAKSEGRYGHPPEGSGARAPRRAARRGSSRGGFGGLGSGGFGFFPLQIAQSPALFDDGVVRLAHKVERVRGDGPGVKVGRARCQKIPGSS